MNTNTKTTRKLSAIMFSDIVGYSRLMGEDETRAINLLEKYKTIVEPVIRDYNGNVIKWMGDGMLIEFTSALKAAECGLCIQNTLYDYNHKEPVHGEIKIRIGIHLGDVVEKENDLFGDGVNVAARIEPLAAAGGICITESIYSAINSHEKFSFDPMGRKELKNIRHPYQLYAIRTKFSPSLSRISENRGKRIKLKKFVLLIVPLFVYLAFNQNIYMPNNDKTIKEKTNRAEVSGIKSELYNKGYKNFIENARPIKEFKSLIDLLLKMQRKGRITFGKKSSYESTNDKFIFIVDQKRVYAFLYSMNGIYFDLNDNMVIRDLSNKYMGKRAIWMEFIRNK